MAGLELRVLRGSDSESWEHAMPPAGSTSVPHHLAVVMSPAGRFMECINCRLRLDFPAEANYDAVAKLFEFYPCSVAPPPKPDDSSD